MKRIMLIGQSRSGKTTLMERLSGEVNKNVLKTQALGFYTQGIDSPGEFLENRQFYGALITASVESDLIGFVQDGTVNKTFFPPQFSSVFTKPVIGIVTKMDCKPIYPEEAEKSLRLAGALKIFHVSVMSGENIETLLDYLSS